MHTSSSPGRAEARGSNSGDRRSERDIQPIPDRRFLGNCRRLIRSQCGTELWEVFEIATHFELVSHRETERFNELWEGIIGQVRLAERSAHDAS
jgi:hypothetical protein